MTDTLAVVGASYAEPGSPLVAELGRLAGVTSRALGVRGATLVKWASLTNYASLRGQSVLVLEMGGNGAPTVANVEAVNTRLRASGAASVRWVLPPVWPVAGTTATRRTAARVAILAANVERVEHTFIPTRGDLSSDAQHLTRDGYLRFASAIWGTPSHRRDPRTGALIVGALVFAFFAWRWVVTA